MKNNDRKYWKHGSDNSSNSYNNDSANYLAKLSNSILEQHVDYKQNYLIILQLTESIDNIKIHKIELSTIDNQ